MLAFAPGAAHSHGVQSNAFRRVADLVLVGATTSALIADYYIKTIRRANLYGTWARLPRLECSQPLASRYLAFNCLSTHYAALWEQVYNLDFADQQWSPPDNPHLQQDFWSEFTSIWTSHGALSSDYARRIVFTNSKSLVCGGLPRKGGPPNTPKTRIQIPDGHGGMVSREGHFGWDDLWTYPDAKAATAPATVPATTTGGPRTVERRYVAPFARVNREEDYRTAWQVFETPPAVSG